MQEKLENTENLMVVHILESYQSAENSPSGPGEGEG